MTTLERQEIEVPAPYTVMLTVLCMMVTIGTLVLGAVMWVMGGGK